jgi:hypothetical protein
MARKPQNLRMSAAQLRVMMRRWRQRVWWGAGIGLLSVLGLIACWRFEARAFWWVLSGLSLMSSVIGVLADINAYQDTKRRVLEIERPCQPGNPNTAE